MEVVNVGGAGKATVVGVVAVQEVAWLASD